MRFTLVALMAAGCAVDTAHSVNVSPSAHDQLPAIVDAVEMLNEMAGSDVYSVRAVGSGDRRDGEIVVRQGDPFSTKRAHTERTRRGVIIVIQANATDLVVAHELGHAAGLGHVAERGNLMYGVSDGIGWSLTERQLDEMR